jgi:acyl-CoA reductase-like NAD-dependent aldehyde dehydrogenase
VSTLQAKYPYYLNNKAVYANEDLEVTDKYTGEVATRCALADPKAIDEGIAGAVRAAEPMAKMASYEKKAVLEHCVSRFSSASTSLPWRSASKRVSRSMMPRAR